MEKEELMSLLGPISEIKGIDSFDPRYWQLLATAAGQIPDDEIDSALGILSTIIYRQGEIPGSHGLSQLLSARRARNQMAGKDR